MIIFLIICCYPSLQPPRQDNSNERSQCMLWKNKENYPCYPLLSGTMIFLFQNHPKKLTALNFWVALAHSPVSKRYGTHKGPIRDFIWAPHMGFATGFHVVPTWANPYGLQMGNIWVLCWIQPKWPLYCQPEHLWEIIRDIHFILHR